MEASEYYAFLLDLIFASPYFQGIKLDYFPGAVSECYVKGHIRLISGHTLHIAEYLMLKPTLVLFKYRYQLLDTDNASVCRWDNAPHHPMVATHPHHEHSVDQRILPSDVHSLPDVLAQLPRFIA